METPSLPPAGVIMQGMEQAGGRWKRRGVWVLVGGALLATLILLAARPMPDPADSIPYLKGQVAGWSETQELGADMAGPIAGYAGQSSDQGPPLRRRYASYALNIDYAKVVAETQRLAGKAKAVDDGEDLSWSLPNGVAVSVGQQPNPHQCMVTIQQIARENLFRVVFRKVRNYWMRLHGESPVKTIIY